MLSKAEIEVIYNALYISLNSRKLKSYIKKHKPSLYKQIYEEQEENALLSIEQIKEIIPIEKFSLIKKIRIAEKELSESENDETLGNIEDFIRWMVIHYNAIHTGEPDIQTTDVDLWRPKKKAKKI